MSVRPYVSPYVSPSVRPSTKSFSDSDEIWYVRRGRWVMHDGMPYDPIQGQGHETFKVKSSIFFNFQNLSPTAFLMWTSKWPLILKLEQYLTFVRSRFLISVLVFVSLDYELGTGWHWLSLQMLLQLQLHLLGGGGVRRQPQQSHTGIIFVNNFIIS